MQVKELYNKCVAELSSHFTVSEANKLTEILFEDLFQMQKSKIQFSDFEISSDQLLVLQNAIERLKKDEPIQYITGQAHFMNFTLKVNPHVLIPRPETEELVEWIINDVKEWNLNVIDIGTGSGCIPIALKRAKHDWSISAIDISQEAITTANENAMLLNEKVNFVEVGIEKAAFDSEKFDLIVSNPPYITYSEKNTLEKNVVDYEPHTALFEPEEFYFYKAIISFAVKYLSLRGTVYVELNQDKALKLRDLFIQYFNVVELKKDISDNYRFLKAAELRK